MPGPYKALSLLSGGRDSQLAIFVLRDQGIHVGGLTDTPAFRSEEPGRRGRSDR